MRRKALHETNSPASLAGRGHHDRRRVRRRRLLVQLELELEPGFGLSSSSSSAALTASAPGITATQITIGSHQPLTGPAAPGYSEIAPASAAYFAYVNANGGVYGRKIVYKYLNDAYNPTTTASVVRQLVLQDNVYAMFDGLGTPTHLAAVSFLNAQKVPDVFVASGCYVLEQSHEVP